MDHGPPDAKRPRVDAWSNGAHNAHRSLPPPPSLPPSYPPSHSPYRPNSEAPHHPDERRHHEPGFPVPMSEPPRSMSIAPPSAYTGYPARETVVKRDPSSEPTQYQPRPNSTGHIGEPHMNPQHHEDHRRQSMTAYDGSGGYRPAYPPHPSPLQHNPMYDQAPYSHHPPPPPTPMRSDSYSHPYTESTGAGQRKKVPRTSQACQQCRSAKAKCDDPKPCSKCVKEGLQCEFKAPEPKQGDKIQAEILEELRMLSSRQLAIERALEKIHPGLHFTEDGDSPKREEADDTGIFDNPPVPTRDLLNADQQKNGEPFYGPEKEDPSESQEEEDEGVVKPFPKSEPTIPVNHTTQASKMLEWPAITNLIGDIMLDPKIKNSQYTIRREVKRGVLRLWGRGEGPYLSHSFSKDNPQDGLADDNASETSASPAAEYVWGQTGVATPPANVTAPFAETERRGGLNLENDLDLDEDTVRDLAGVYMNLMNIMHPILFPAQLERLIKGFLKSIPESNPVHKGPVAAFTGSNGVPENRKRKRSVEPGEPPTAMYLRPGRPQRSIDAAVVLLVMALGKICLHKDKIPDCLPDQDTTNHPSLVPNGSATPGHTPPAITPQSSLPSPKDSEKSRSSNRRSSMDAGTMPRRLPPSPRNLNVIPGLAYFAAATDIIGNQLGGNTLLHVQANILASLYQGQLARIAEAQAYIHQAARALQVLLAGKSGRFQELAAQNQMGTEKDGPLLIAFWTCLQLESDILAELPFPQSGILSTEEHMPWPDIAVISGKEGIPLIHLLYYIKQLMLRKRLNYIHKDLYEGGRQEAYQLPLSPWNERKLLIGIGAIEDSLKAEFVHPDPLPPNADESKETPSLEILKERFQAKGLGAYVITYRPCLMMVLNRLPGQVPSDSILEKAILCVRHTLDSTRAFSTAKMGPGRLIITNVWGTAHAQWGNVIVLQAAYRDELLQKYIDADDLRSLIRKTLNFLEMVAQPSSALAQDIRILECMALKNNLLIPQDSVLNSSFTSGPST